MFFANRISRILGWRSLRCADTDAAHMIKRTKAGVPLEMMDKPTGFIHTGNRLDWNRVI